MLRFFKTLISKSNRPPTSALDVGNVRQTLDAMAKSKQESKDAWAVIKFKEDNGIKLSSKEFERQSAAKINVERMLEVSKLRKATDMETARSLAPKLKSLDGMTPALKMIRDALFTLKQGVQVPLTLEMRKDWFSMLGSLFICMTWQHSKLIENQHKLIPQSLFDEYSYDIVHFALLHLINDLYCDEFGERYDEEYINFEWQEDILWTSLNDDMTGEVIYQMITSLCHYSLATSNSALKKDIQDQNQRAMTLTAAEIAHNKRANYFIQLETTNNLD